MTLPRALPEVQDTGVSACTHLSELGEPHLISLGPWTQVGLREEGETLTGYLPTFSLLQMKGLPMILKIPQMNPAIFIYLLIYLTILRY